MNFSSLGMGIRIAMFAEIFFGVKQLLLKNYGQNAASSGELSTEEGPDVGMSEGECNRRFVHSRCLKLKSEVVRNLANPKDPWGTEIFTTI